jgi:hypothetical protein
MQISQLAMQFAILFLEGLHEPLLSQNLLQNLL